MASTLQRLIERLLPSEGHFYTYLEEQAALVQRAADAFLPAAEPGANYEEIRAAVRGIEKEADVVNDRMIQALGATFVTPIDREDLQRLSKRFDDIVDLLDVAARSFIVFSVKAPTEAGSGLIRLIHDSCLKINELTPLLRKNSYDEVIQGCRKLAENEKQGDRVFRDELSRLFADPAIDAKEILRAREVLDHLEDALDKCRSASETMVDIAVKHA